jgi:hypothetical protein
MLKRIALTIVAFFLIGCAGMQAKAGSFYPLGTTDNPNVQTLIEHVKREGYKLLGLGTDVVGNNVIWLEDKDGNCAAFLIDNQRMLINELESCEKALELWNECLEADQCIDPATKI